MCVRVEGVRTAHAYEYPAISLVGSFSVSRVVGVSASVDHYQHFAESGDLSEREAGLLRFIRATNLRLSDLCCVKQFLYRSSSERIDDLYLSLRKTYVVNFNITSLFVNSLSVSFLSK